MMILIASFDNFFSKYFSRVGLGDCPPGRNLADFALESLDNRVESLKQFGQGADPAAIFLAVRVWE